MNQKNFAIKFYFTCYYRMNYGAVFSLMAAQLSVDCYCPALFHRHLSRDHLRDSIHLHWDRNLLKIAKEIIVNKHCVCNLSQVDKKRNSSWDLKNDFK